MLNFNNFCLEFYIKKRRRYFVCVYVKCTLVYITLFKNKDTGVLHLQCLNIEF